MLSPEVLRSEAGHYHLLAQQLKAEYVEIDEETLADTLEGLSELPDLLKAVVRSSLEDEALLGGLKARLSDMKARLERIEERQKRKRELVCTAMGHAGLDRLLAEDFSVSCRQGPPRLEVCDEKQVPNQFLIPQAPKLDRAGILAALKRGEIIAGTSLLTGLPHIQVRTK